MLHSGSFRSDYLIGSLIFLVMADAALVSMGFKLAPWLSALFLQGMLVVVIIAKRAWRAFPFFVIYAVLNFVYSAVL